MTCREFIDFLIAYLDEDLDTSRRRVFEEHIGECPACGDYLANYRQTIAMGKMICDPEGEAPDDVPEPLIQAILAARSEVG